jgi:hypothetical protein
LVGVGACDAQVTRDYRGERLAEIRGHIVAEGAPVAAEAALLWWGAEPPTSTATAPAGLATKVTTEGAFPAGFTLSIYRQPPEAALVELGAAARPAGLGLRVAALFDGRLVCRVPPAWGADAGRIALATIAAVAPGAAPPDRAGPGAALGADEGHAVAFVPAGGRGGAPLAGAGLPLAPGYHLLRLAWSRSPAPGALPCRRSAGGTDARAAAAPAASGGGDVLYLTLREAAAGIAGTPIQIRLPGGPGQPGRAE